MTTEELKQLACQHGLTTQQTPETSAAAWQGYEAGFLKALELVYAHRDNIQKKTSSTADNYDNGFNLGTYVLLEPFEELL